MAEILRNLFSRFGLPLQIVSENGPQFTSTEFEKFMKRYGIKHIRTAPFHPSSNGAAERVVGVLKNAIKASRGSFDIRNFLLASRTKFSTCQHSTTVRSPAELMFGRKLRTRLDLLKPNLEEEVLEKQDQIVRRSPNRERQFVEGQNVLVRTYRTKRKWTRGCIAKQIGDKHYLVKVDDATWKRHVDQLLPSEKLEQKLSDSSPPPLESNLRRSNRISRNEK